jgi:hypothetical protein
MNKGFWFFRAGGRRGTRNLQLNDLTTGIFLNVLQTNNESSVSQTNGLALGKPTVAFLFNLKFGNQLK